MNDLTFLDAVRSSHALLFSYRFFIAVTAFDPLSRFDALLKTLQGYTLIPGKQDFYIFIDHEHAEDKKLLKELLEPNLDECGLEIIVADPQFTGFSLTWSHKQLLTTAVSTKSYDFYVYTENDMYFTEDNFYYWWFWKDKLKVFNLEPGFCRYENLNGRLIPFDNHKKWSLSRTTPNIWGNRGYDVQTYLTPYEDFVCFASLGNPYMGMMILDQEMAEKYVGSDSCDPIKSFEVTKFRCWPIADRSSMGLAFENLQDNQEHRRVVPLIKVGNHVEIAKYGLLEHMDTKYSQQMLTDNKILLELSEMFEL
jgi:hypothetical protein